MGSTANAKAGSHGIGADLKKVMEKHGIGEAAAAAANVAWSEWFDAMKACLQEPGTAALKGNPPSELAGLVPVFTDAPLTLSGKRGLRKTIPESLQQLAHKPFKCVIVSP